MNRSIIARPECSDEMFRNQKKCFFRRMYIIMYDWSWDNIFIKCFYDDIHHIISTTKMRPILYKENIAGRRKLTLFFDFKEDKEKLDLKAMLTLIS